MPSIIKIKGYASEDGNDGHKNADAAVFSNGGKKSPTPHEMDDVESVASCVELLGEEKKPPTQKSKAIDDVGDSKKCQDEKTAAVAVEVEMKIDEKSGDDNADEEPQTKKNKTIDNDTAVDANSGVDHVDDAKLKG